MQMVLVSDYLQTASQLFSHYHLIGVDPEGPVELLVRFVQGYQSQFDPFHSHP